LLKFRPTAQCAAYAVILLCIHPCTRTSAMSDFPAVLLQGYAVRWHCCRPHMHGCRLLCTLCQPIFMYVKLESLLAAAASPRTVRCTSHVITRSLCCRAAIRDGHRPQAAGGHLPGALNSCSCVCCPTCAMFEVQLTHQLFHSRSGHHRRLHCKCQRDARLDMCRDLITPRQLAPQSAPCLARPAAHSRSTTPARCESLPAASLHIQLQLC
jgi:hypothetical protein